MVHLKKKKKENVSSFTYLAKLKKEKKKVVHTFTMYAESSEAIR